MAILKILNGMHAGRSFELHGTEVTLGRTRDCDVILAAGRVSRKHARILLERDACYLEDLDSRNGTFVNGEKVSSRRRLRDRDRIQLADFVLSFHSEAPPADDASSLLGAAQPHLPEEADTPLPTIMSSLDALAHLRVDRNPADKLRALLEISSHLGSALETAEILGRILDSLFRVFRQADRGYVLLLDERTGRLEPQAMKLRNEDAALTMTIRPISRTITEKVMLEGRAILSADVQADQRFTKSSSVLDFEIRSMICAPLLGPSREPCGILYLDTQDPDREFTEDDLDVLVSVATLVGQTVELARAHQTLLDERQEAEDTLRASELRFRAVWDSSADAMRLTDENGIVLAVNQAYSGIVDLPAEKLVGRPFTCVYGSEHDARELLRKYRSDFRGGTLEQHVERSFTFHSSRQVELSIKRSLIELEPGNRVLLSIFRDITERKRTEEALQESEQQFEALYRDAAIGIAAADLDGRLLHANPALERILGYTSAALLGRELCAIVEEDECRKIKRIWRALVNTERHEYRTECRFAREDGSPVWGNLTMSLVRGTDGAPRHAILMLEDISDRKRLEREVADLAVQEQQRIGQELHDELGQVLTGMSFMSRTLLERLIKQNSSETTTARQISEGIQRALSQVRSIAKGLVPVEIDGEGLRYALQELAASCARQYDIQVDFECDQPLRVEDSRTAVHLYHIAQEAITNAFKHGNAKKVVVRFGSDRRELHLQIRDDGVGMQLPQTPTGIGLRIMRYRAGIIGGSLDIQSPPEGGTLVVCTIENLQDSNDDLPAVP